MKLTEHSAWPLIADYWCHSKNPDPDTLTHAAHISVWMVCSNGHESQYSLPVLTKNGLKCRACKKISFTHPELAKQWDTSRNARSVDTIGPGFGSAWWICRKVHSFKASVDNRVRPGGDICPICTGRRVVSGINDIESQRPYLLELWSSKNKRSPKTVWHETEVKFHWDYPCGHSYFDSQYEAINGCKYCKYEKFLPGFNGLDVTHPELIKDWADENVISPDQVFYKSNKKIIWVCSKCGYKRKRPISLHVSSPRACAACAGNVAHPGLNDLPSIAPELLSLYDPIATGRPATKVLTSHKVYWKCPKGHSYPGTVRNMINSLVRCNICSPRSNLEDEIFDFCLREFSEFEVYQNTRSVISPYELDVYVPKANFAIEVNGDYWHSDEMIRKSRGISAEEYHNLKTDLCNKLGITLIFVWESDWRKKAEDVSKVVKRAGLLSQWAWIHTSHE